MPFIPWDVRDPVTGEFPSFLPYADELNSALPVICPAYNQLEEWQRNAYADLVPGGGGAISRLLTGRNLWDNVCQPFGGAPITQPAIAQVPTFPEDCATFGVITYQQQTFPAQTPPVWVTFTEEWDCTDNIGIPIGQPTWFQFAPAIFGYRLRFRRPDGVGETSFALGQYPLDERDKVSIQSIQIQYCPGCGFPDPPPVPPVIPPAQDDPIPRPTINLPITIPQPVGLPPINVEIPYAPVINVPINASVQPTLTLAPNVELAPEFAFAPTFEFNVGGVSIGGGGYPEPREDVAEIVDCDCPDPCPPPGDEVDYQRIQNAVGNVIASRWRLPGFDREPSFGAFSSFAEAGRIIFDPDAIAVQIQLDTTNYTGGGTPTINGVQGIGYYGWFTWIAINEFGTGSERHFLSSNGGITEIPPYSIGLTFYCQNGATARVRQVRLGEIPPA